MHKLVGIIKRKFPKTRTKDFAKEYLEMSYPTFHYRMNHNLFTVEDIHRLCFHLQATFDELFPNPYDAPVIRRVSRVSMVGPVDENTEFDVNGKRYIYHKAIHEQEQEFQRQQEAQLRHPVMEVAQAIIDRENEELRQQKTSGGLPEVDAYDGLDVSPRGDD